MKVYKILGMTFIHDDTEIFIRDTDLHLLTKGNWYQDNVLKYKNYEVESFTWQDDNKVYIDVK